MSKSTLIKDEPTILEQNDVPIPKTDIQNRLTYLYAKFFEAGDQKNAFKVSQLIDKVANEEFLIAFCGHFSAGKSSLVNELVGESLLPSSPIPTSANLVKVKSGKPGVRIHFNKGNSVDLPYPYNIDEVKKYCLDGDQVASVEISHPHEWLSMGLSIMDTPGIDSTDDAHRVATESALHLADIVFYVMDYNHVQSELNFSFTKRLIEQGKKVYLVINQIDKHSEYELPFSTYIEGVQSSFLSWDVIPEGIFFTSLMEPKLPTNQLEKLKSTLKSSVNDKEERLLANALRAGNQLIEDHIEWKNVQNLDQVETYEAILEGLESNEIAVLEALISETSQERNYLLKYSERFEEEIKGDLAKIFHNANLIPYQTRELAQNFLEASQPNFKVGLLFSGKKTKQERQLRLASFYDDLVEKVSAQIDWHVKELLVKGIEAYGIDKEDLKRDIFDMQLPFSQDLLFQFVKPGAGINGDALLQYVHEVTEGIKQSYRRVVNEKLTEIQGILKELQVDKVLKLEQRLNELEAKHEALLALQHLQEVQERDRLALNEILQGNYNVNNLTSAVQLYQSEKEKQNASIVLDSSQHQLEKKTMQSSELVREKSLENINGDFPRDSKNDGVISNHVDKPLSSEVEMDQDVVAIKNRLDHTSDTLRRGASLIDGIQGMQSFVKELQTRANRIENRQFTVALFGAFSAGKSSFANALIGERLLPVSPNPTTATINRILPVTEQHPHGSVRVKLKSPADLLLDIQQSLEYFGVHVRDLDEILPIINKLNPTQLSPRAKPHFSFLKAVERGMGAIQQDLGKVLSVDIKTFQDFVAQEEKACFTESIDLYFDCPVTRQGISLVDTPGADSINARHTGVAFEYIKNADAILFVTYYNHAFSNADYDFLVQLGRVKDSFELDKMFFIINAADLARTQEELEGVTHYVRENLVTCGIRNPRIFSVSSQLALLAQLKEQQDKGTSGEDLLEKYSKKFAESGSLSAEKALQLSGILNFEKDFFSYINGELTETAITAAMVEMERVHQRLQEYITTAKAGEDEREAKLREMLQLKGKAITEVRQREFRSDEQALTKEIDELLYYIKHRLFIQFSDTFKRFFNPATLREDGQDMKQILQGALDELVRFIGFDLSQEIRVTTLRIDRFIAKNLESTYRQFERSLQRIFTQFSLIHLDVAKHNTPEEIIAEFKLDVALVKPALSHYKNGKQFFEQNGKEKMKEALENSLQQPVADYLSQIAIQLKEKYLSTLERDIEVLKGKVIEQIEEYSEGKLASLSVTFDVNRLEEITVQFTEQISDLRGK